MINDSRAVVHELPFKIAGGFLLLALLLVSQPSALAQDPPTPTADAAGNIFVIVQPNDSLWAIAARAGISLEELLALNNLTVDSIITPGQQLLIGRAAPPATPTAMPTATATKPPPPPTATAVPPPRTALCLKAFTDLNRNGEHDPGEPFKAEVAFTIYNEEAVVGNYVTDGSSEPYCLEDLVAGDYNVTRSMAKNETLTTAGDWSVTLAQGNEVEMAFGSYTAVTPTIAEQPPAATITPANSAAIQEDGRITTIFIGTAVVVIFLLADWFIYQHQKRK